MRQKRNKRTDTSNFIMGKNCLEEVFKSHPEKILQIFTSMKKQHPFLKHYKDYPITFVNKNELSELVDSESHQSIAAKIKERYYPEFIPFINKIASNKNACILMIDSIFDPQNLGALIRACECFQINAIVYSKNRGSTITPVVTKASVGGTELVPILRVSNLADTLKKCQKAGFHTIAATLSSDSKLLPKYEFPAKTLLIVGSEGKGIQPLLLKAADDHVQIPIFGKIDSLNVSQATVILLYTWRLQHAL